MKYAILSFLMMSVMSNGLYAGLAQSVEKDDAIYKLLKMSVDYKVSEKNKDKFMFTVKVAGKGIGDIYLLSNDKNLQIKPSVKDDQATITFEVDKSSLDKSRLHFAYPNKSMCPPSYELELKNYVKK